MLWHKTVVLTAGKINNIRSICHSLRFPHMFVMIWILVPQIVGIVCFLINYAASVFGNYSVLNLSMVWTLKPYPALLLTFVTK